MKRICSYIFIIGAAFVLMSCNAAASAGAPQPRSADSTATSTAVPVQHSAIGQQTNVGNTWMITLTSATVATGSGFAPPTTGNDYLVVALTFKNISNQTQTLATAYSLTLTDSVGEQYNQVAVANLGKAPDGDIAAGSQVDGQLVYTVPQTQHAFALAFQNDASLSGNVVWDITD